MVDTQPHGRSHDSDHKNAEYDTDGNGQVDQVDEGQVDHDQLANRVHAGDDLEPATVAISTEVTWPDGTTTTTSPEAGAFEDTDNDGTAELQTSHADFQGGDAQNVGALGADDARVGVPKRKLVSETAKTVTVDPAGGADYSSLQAAVDEELSGTQQHDLTFDLAGGAYGEDVTVSGATVVPKAGDAADTIVQISGDATTPGNVTGLSLYIQGGGKRAYQIEGIEADRIHPASDTASIQYVGDGACVIRDCNYRESSTAGSRAISAYGGTTILKGSHDLGSGNLSHGIVAKNGGVVIDETGGQITGSVPGVAYWNQAAVYFGVDAGSGLSGSPTYRVDRGPEFTIFSGSNIGAGATGNLRRQRADVQTISSGAADATAPIVQLAGESGAADTLTTLNCDVPNVEVTLRANGAEDITVESGTGNIKLSTSSFTLSSPADTLRLQYDGGSWLEISRSDNA